MTSHSPHNDDHSDDIPPSEKRKIVRFIGIAVAFFLIAVVVYMLMNLKPAAEDLPINNNPTIEQTEQ